MAVDRHKFRTCQQTSFCRRHRDGHSARLYQYELVPDSLEFHVDVALDAETEKKDGEGGGGASDGDGSMNNNEGGGGMWSSLSRRLLGKSNNNNKGDIGSHPNNNNGGMDPYIRGTRPTLTGTLVNTATETSSGGAVREELTWSVFAMDHGIVRMRVTEKYGIAGSAHEMPRVTYDDLVLESPETWKAASHAQWMRASSMMNEASEDNTAFDLLKQLIAQTGQVLSYEQESLSLDNFMALEYGDDHSDADAGHDDNILLIQLKPFAVWLFRKSNIDAGPVIVLNAQSMMSFEVRRFKDEAKEQEAEKLEQEAAKKEEEAAHAEKNKEEKEVVGYWEDGLAIYADGTREEKKVDDENTAETNDEKDELDHRKLSEEELHELDRQGFWEESFDTHHDSKPYGPMSVGMDIAFPQSKHLYGLPEHASSAVLQTTFSGGNGNDVDTHYKEPYRLYNLDVFEYEIDETMALYGEVPLIVSQSAVTGTSGVFWFNPTETFVDVMQTTQETSKTTTTTTTTTHWMSESGIVDLFLLSGPNPASLYEQYGHLTGTTPVPPMFSLGYHQCRWNYKDEKDVYHVNGKFEELDYPYDVLWLDIEHTDGKRYFTWDDRAFPNPVTMQETLWAQGRRRMVTIIDPHIKRDDAYTVHKEATAKGLYIKDKDGQKDYDGWCWPGSSSYLDFTQEKVRQWWASLFSYNKYKGSTPTLFTWNDMNEPSVFNGPEVSMQKDLRNLNGEEHREWHNLYGMLFHRATAEGQVARNEHDKEAAALGGIRPFVLSRAFFAGSQKYGAIWTGDNTAVWEHLEITAPMLLNLNTAALSFVGSDVGGFFGNPDAELFTRWMQSGAYQPFFRGHAHHDSKRREPWTFDAATLARCRRAAMSRYALLPTWYTVFHHAYTTGMPVLRMMWMEYPSVSALYGVDDQYLIGSDLLVHPVTQAGVTEVTVLFPSQDVWYHADTLQVVSVGGSGGDNEGVVSLSVPADIDTVPVFQRGGSILARKLRLRRSSQLMKTDPYTLFVALDGDRQQAKGSIYMDDEETFAYQTQHDFALAAFHIQPNEAATSSWTMTNTVEKGAGWKESAAANRMIERIVLVGTQLSKPASVAVVVGDGDKRALEFDHNEETKLVVIRQPLISAAEEWKIVISL